ncbi:MAG: cyclase family protein [Deltaproteobacteria bacterium]|nr:cyclase family protein [Deltaproteobacteria bacterium]
MNHSGSNHPTRRISHNGWIDISVPLRSGMAHWPHDPPVQIERLFDLRRGDVYTLSKLSMSAHAGTHMDAPLHFIQTGKGLDEMPFAATIGPARVIEIHDPESIRPDVLRSHRIRRGERVLFKTKNSTRCWNTDSFVEDFVHLSIEAARFLAGRGVRAVGIDYLSVGGYLEKNGPEVHRALLEAGVWIIEGLDLSRVRPGTYELLCLPLRILRGDGAPARAILRPIRRGGGRTGGRT